MRPPLNRTPVVLRMGRRETTQTQGGSRIDRRASRPQRDASGVQVAARVQWVEQSRARERSRPTGDQPESTCYFLMRPAELAALEATAGVSLAKGDAVITKNGVTLRPRLYVVEIRDTAHQQVANGGTLKQVFLSDRSPAGG